MAVPIEFINVVVRRATLEAKYPGGEIGYERDYGGATFAMDAHLTRVGFMESADAESLVRSLEQRGLQLLGEQGFVDIAIVDVLGGPTRPCAWLEWSRAMCWLAGTAPGEVVETREATDERQAPGPAGRSLLGLTIGDCLGAGVEGWSATDIAAAHGETGGAVRRFRYEPMVWTDDTQQALTLIEATKRFGFPEPGWVAERWVEMAARRLHRGTGRGFRAAVGAFAKTGDPSVSGRTDRAGNGAAMRIGPTAVALRHLSDEEFVRRLVDVSLITHREVRALAGMLAVAYVARALADDWYPPKRQRAKAVLGGLVDWLAKQERALLRHPAVVTGEDREHEVSRALEGVAWRWGEGWPGIAEWIESNASRCRGSSTRLGEGFVTASVVTAASWSLSSIAMLPETIVSAIGFGDDTDTMAAMVGGIAGPGTPRHSLPSEWNSFAGRGALVAWGRSIDSGEPIEDLPDILDLEERLTRLVRGKDAP